MNKNVQVGCLIIPVIACILYMVQSGIAGDYYSKDKEVLIEIIELKGKPVYDKESQAILVNNFILYCSMRTGTFPNGTMGDSFEEQAGNALGHMWYCLEAVKTIQCDYDNVAHMTVYLKDMKNLEKFNSRMSGFYKKPWPTRLITEVPELPENGKVAVSIVAYCGKVIRKPQEYSTEEEY